MYIHATALNMFKFGFSETEDQTMENTNSAQNAEIPYLSAQQVEIDEDLSMPEEPDIINFQCEGVPEIQHLCTKAVMRALKEDKTISPIVHADSNHSDLVTGIYEGGLKIWECTYDLAKYICCNNVELDNKTVLDLGCGAGIIGILSLLKGAFTHFQDYNSEVITTVTIPNLILNLDRVQDNKRKFCKCITGDWKSFTDNATTCKYDIIFTSETIYNTDNYEKLHELFEKNLKPDGVIYLAAKTYYFGVGGGTREFEDLMQKKDVFNFETCWSCSTGIQREILRITFKTKVSCMIKKMEIN